MARQPRTKRGRFGTWQADQALRDTLIESEKLARYCHTTSPVAAPAKFRFREKD